MMHQVNLQGMKDSLLHPHSRYQAHIRTRLGTKLPRHGLCLHCQGHSVLLVHSPIRL